METKHNLLSENKSKILTVVLVLAVIVGFLIRIKGLGKWPLTVDEYYIVKAIKSILKNGLPDFEYGGYYDRGILYQYLTALLFLSGIKVELAARLIPVITNMLVVHPLYLLSKKAGGRILAVAVVAVFCLSLWEVEFARFARMYSPFQLVFVWYLYFLYKNLIENDKSSLRWLFTLSFISIFIYEASVFLAILNFLPFLWNGSKKTFDLAEIGELKKSYGSFIISILIFLTAYFYISFNFMALGTANNLPQNINYEILGDHSGGKFRMPLILIGTLITNPVWIIPFLIVLVISGYNYIKVYGVMETGFYFKLSILILFILSFLNLFGLAVFMFILFLLINWMKTKEFKNSFKFIAAGISILFIFWSLYAVFTTSWHYYFFPKEISGVVSSLKFIWKEFLNYPYLYETYVLFRDTIPHLTYVTVVLMSCGLFMAIFLKNNKNDQTKFLFFIFMFLMLFVTTLSLLYFKTRYFFFLYPLLILLNLSVIERLLNIFKLKTGIKTASFLILIATYLVISEDFNVDHLYNIDSKEVNYRINYSKKLKDHYYPRWDIKTPDDYVNKRVKEDDIVIIDEQVSEYYLDRVDYIYKDYTDNAEFPGISMLNGKKERWTGTDLIYTTSGLVDTLMNNNSTKWLIINTVWGIRFLKADSFFVKFRKYEVFNNSDTTTIVYKIPPDPDVE